MAQPFLFMRVRVIRQIFQLQCMIEKPRPVLLTQPTEFYDLSVSRNLFSKAEMRQFGASGTEGLRIIIGSSRPGQKEHWDRVSPAQSEMLKISTTVCGRRSSVLNNLKNLPLWWLTDLKIVYTGEGWSKWDSSKWDKIRLIGAPLDI